MSQRNHGKRWIEDCYQLVMKNTAEEKQLEGVERLKTQGQKMTESLRTSKSLPSQKSRVEAELRRGMEANRFPIQLIVCCLSQAEGKGGMGLKNVQKEEEVDQL